MTPKQRLHDIMNGKKTDRPACICPGGMMNMITTELMEKVDVFFPEAHTDAVKMAKLAKAAYEQGCFENYGVPYCMTVEAEEMGAKVDMGSDKYEPHVTKYVIDTVSDYEKLKNVTPERKRSEVVLEAIRILKKETSDVPIVGNLTGPISTASSVIEPTIFYKELRKKNADAHKYMEYVTDRLIDFGKAQIEAGADIIAISDPSGTGEILGPRYFEEFAVTYLNRLIDGLRTEGVGIIVHICGQMNQVYEQVQHVKSDVLSFDSIVNLREAKNNLSNRILMGNVSTYTLEFGTPDKVRELTKVCMKNGSDILSPACGLGMKSPLKNVQAILAEVES